MAEKARKLTVRLSAEALATLDSIWLWNAGRYGLDHADQYIEFLRAAALQLPLEYPQSRIVPTRPNLSYRTVRRGRGHGHVIVFELIASDIVIHNFYHTAQNWKENVR